MSEAMLTLSQRFVSRGVTKGRNPYVIFAHTSTHCTQMTLQQ